MSDSVNVTMPRDEQAVACFIGGGVVLIARDGQTPDWEVTAAQAAVTAARLRAAADRVERCAPCETAAIR